MSYHSHPSSKPSSSTHKGPSSATASSASSHQTPRASTRAENISTSPGPSSSTSKIPPRAPPCRKCGHDLYVPPAWHPDEVMSITLAHEAKCPGPLRNFFQAPDANGVLRLSQIPPDLNRTFLHPFPDQALQPAPAPPPAPVHAPAPAPWPEPVFLKQVHPSMTPPCRKCGASFEAPLGWVVNELDALTEVHERKCRGRV